MAADRSTIVIPPVSSVVVRSKIDHLLKVKNNTIIYLHYGQSRQIHK